MLPNNFQFGFRSLLSKGDAHWPRCVSSVPYLETHSVAIQLSPSASCPITAFENMPSFFIQAECCVVLGLVHVVIIKFEVSFNAVLGFELADENKRGDGSCILDIILPTKETSSAPGGIGISCYSTQDLQRDPVWQFPGRSFPHAVGQNADPSQGCILSRKARKNTLSAAVLKIGLPSYPRFIHDGKLPHRFFLAIA